MYRQLLCGAWRGRVVTRPFSLSTWLSQATIRGKLGHNLAMEEVPDTTAERAEAEFHLAEAMRIANSAIRRAHKLGLDVVHSDAFQ